MIIFLVRLKFFILDQGDLVLKLNHLIHTFRRWIMHQYHVSGGGGDGGGGGGIESQVTADKILYLKGMYITRQILL